MKGFLGGWTLVMKSVGLVRPFPPPPEYYSILCIVVPELYIIPRRWQLLRTFPLVKRDPQYTWRVVSATLFHDVLKSSEPVKPR